MGETRLLGQSCLPATTLASNASESVIWANSVYAKCISISIFNSDNSTAVDALSMAAGASKSGLGRYWGAVPAKTEAGLAMLPGIVTALVESHLSVNQSGAVDRRQTINR